MQPSKGCSKGLQVRDYPEDVRPASLSMGEAAPW